MAGGVKREVPSYFKGGDVTSIADYFDDDDATCRERPLETLPTEPHV